MCNIEAMGNCLALQDKVIRIMKMDGKVLEYQAPLRVQQVLSNFAGHAISDTLPVHRHLPPNTELLSGGLYYLLPPSLPSTGVDKNLLMLSNSDVNSGQVSRIKLVINKQELKEMLSKGVVTVDEMISHLQNKDSKYGIDACDGDANGSSKGWRPLLESIPEGTDLS